MQYPLSLRFKLLAIASQIYVNEANGNLVFYVKQKAFKLKEDITVFGDQEQTRPLFTIKADRIIDFSAHYHFTAANGASVGSIKRHGARSWLKATYDIMDAQGNIQMTLVEENPWIRALEGLASEIPLAGPIVAYYLNPIYSITRPDGTVVMRITKKRSLLERLFEIDKLADMHPHDEARAVLGTLMMLVLERTRS